MRQEVNFFRSSGSGDRLPPLRFETLWRGLLGLALLLAVMSFFQLKDMRALREQLQQAQDGANDAEQRLAAVRAAYPDPKPDPALIAQADGLQKQIDGFKQLLDRLESHQLNAQRGFSALFEGLARQPPRELWLNSIRLSQSGDAIALRGSALRQDDIPQWVQTLAKDPAMRHAFTRLAIREPAEGAKRFDFELGTEPQREGEQPHGQP